MAQLLSEPYRRAVGWTTALGGTGIAALHDLFSGISVAGLAGGIGAIGGAAILLYDSIRTKKRDNDRKDREARLEWERAERAQREEWDRRHEASLAGKLEHLQRTLEEIEVRHQREREAAERVQDEQQQALDLANENAKHIRESLHDLRNKAAATAAERDLLRSQLAEANGALEALRAKAATIDGKATRIEEKVTRITDSRDDLPASGLEPPR